MLWSGWEAQSTNLHQHPLMQLNPSQIWWRFWKCSELRYLGHIVSEAGIAPDADKIQAVSYWKVPSTETELRSFLGLCGYYRCFVPGYAKITAPLRALLGGPSKKKHKKKRRRSDLPPKLPVPEAWNDDCSKAFEELKHCLTTAPVLGYPDFQRTFILEVDASFLGLGAVLSQERVRVRKLLLLMQAEGWDQMNGICVAIVF